MHENIRLISKIPDVHCFQEGRVLHRIKCIGTSFLDTMLSFIIIISDKTVNYNYATNSLNPHF